MRLAWYAGASTALAGGVVISAFHQRANFYSAMVYLYQSNMCMMILANLLALVYSSFVYTLQRVCFGQLRAVEVEQLYERAWFAMTETCLAMTIFRDEIGGSFIVMFAILLTGKVWGWIGEGRIEALEQQPPANPRLFHARLTISLLLSLVYDAWFLYYCLRTVIYQARPDMMVMFLFEFAALLTTSLQTALRYTIILLDIAIVKRQTRARLQERRREIREERAAILRRREAGEEDSGEPLPDEDDVDEVDIEVPGWEAKGLYVLALDLWTDFTKLCIYTMFFFVLMSFYGLPLHIIRDLFMTIRSFIKRLGALLKYRQAIRDMNRYADATEEELARENTCIICREDMHVWDRNDPGRIERTRPKKLPCGHILHLGCLKSWMERQQVCPTCRRSVVINDAAPQRHDDPVVFQAGLNIGGAGAAPNAAGAGAGGGVGAGPAAAGLNALAHPHAAHGHAPAPAARQAFDAHHNGPNQMHNQPPPADAPHHGGGLRMFNLGPLRLGFAQGGAQDIQEMMRRLGAPGAIPDGDPNNAAGPPRGPVPGAAVDIPDGFDVPGQLPHYSTRSSSALAVPANSPEAILSDLQDIERRIEAGMIELQIAHSEAQTLRHMLEELRRIRRGAPAAPASQASDASHAVQEAPEAAQTSEPATIAGASSSPLGQATGAPQENEVASAGMSHTTMPSETAPPHRQAASTVLTPSPAPAVFQTHLFGQPSSAPFDLSRLGPQPAGLAQHHGQRVGSPLPAAHFTPARDSPPIPSGSSELPAGVQIPAGWSLLPLERFGTTAVDASGPSTSTESTEQGQGTQAAHSTVSAAATATTPRPVTMESVPDASPEESTGSGSPGQIPSASWSSGLSPGPGRSEQSDS